MADENLGDDLLQKNAVLSAYYAARHKIDEAVADKTKLAGDALTCGQGCAQCCAPELTVLDLAHDAELSRWPVVRQAAALELLQGNPHLIKAHLVGLNLTDQAAPALAHALSAPHGRLEVLKGLIELGADVNERDRDGLSALSFAAIAGNVQALLLLLEGGAEVDLATSQGRTPLMLAASRGHEDAVGVLLMRGADPERTAKGGVTARSLAEEQGYPRLAEAIDLAARRKENERP